MSRTRIYSDKLKGFKHECADCRDDTKMTSTGYLFEPLAGKKWSMEFECDKNGEKYTLWNIKYKSLIEEVLKNEELSR